MTHPHLELLGAELDTVMEAIKATTERNLEEEGDNTAIQLELNKLYDSKRSKVNKRNILRGRMDEAASKRNKAKEKLEQAEMNRCDIVCTTLSGSGMKPFSRTKPFDLVIVDEAAQVQACTQTRASYQAQLQTYARAHARTHRPWSWRP